MKRNYKLLVFLILSCTTQSIFYSCRGITYGTEEGLAKTTLYSAQIAYYEKEYKKAKGDAKGPIAYKIAKAYFNNDEFQKANNWITKTEAANYNDAKVTFLKAQILKTLERQEEAIPVLQKYQGQNPEDPRAALQIVALQEYAADKKDNCQVYDVTSFRLANSPNDDYGPWLDKKQGMFFTSDREEDNQKSRTDKNKKKDDKKRFYARTNRPFYDIYMLPRKRTKKGDTWDKVVKPVEGGINTPKENQGTATLDEKGGLMIYSDCNGLLTPENTKKIRPNCVLKMARKQGKGYGNPEILSFCSDTVIFYGSPSLSPDGSKLLFAMDNPAGFGNQDIYLTSYVKRNKTWSDPVNLGPNINTQGREMFAYWFNDSTIYFASDGLPGIGGLDIFRSHGRGSEWSKPEHMRYPINSGGDDFGIIFDETKINGYLTSNRTGSRLLDIYQFSLRPQEYFVNGTVYLLKDGVEQLYKEGADVTLLNQSAINPTPITFTTKGDGKFRFQIPQGAKFNVSVYKSGYEPTIDHGTAEGNTADWICSRDTEVRLVIQVPKEIEIPGILYDLDKATLKPESIVKLDSVYSILTTYPFLVIELGSHTDCRASKKYNDSLSLERAKSCIVYLLDRGIDSVRLVPRGYGESQLKNNCGCEPNNKGPGASCTEPEHAINRRTTIKVIRRDYAPKKDEVEEEIIEE
ncbi:MAG: OmpA family protein [Bacteroidota bacterium]|nr:OmpA family protein [Bacteroidota bacterium]